MSFFSDSRNSGDSTNKSAYQKSELVLTESSANDKLSSSLNLIPIRSEKMDDAGIDEMLNESVSQQESAEMPVDNIAADVPVDFDEELEQLRNELITHVHHENVRCYRNVQAVIIDNTDKILKQAEKNQRSLKGLMTSVVVLLILNLAAVAALAVFMLR